MQIQPDLGTGETPTEAGRFPTLCLYFLPTSEKKTEERRTKSCVRAWTRKRKMGKWCLSAARRQIIGWWEKGILFPTPSNRGGKLTVLVLERLLSLESAYS